MSRPSFNWTLSAVLIALIVGIVSAQSTADKYVISAEAGGVSFVEGTAARSGAHNGTLIKGDKVSVGDRVSTSADGRLEVLMNPGSYIRLGGNSEFSFQSTSLDDLRVSLYAGSAIFEVFATEKFKVDVTTPTGVVRIEDSGVYRFDLAPDGSGTVAVIEGKARIDGQMEYVKKGRQAEIESSGVASKYEKKQHTDDLATWSRDRSKSLAKVTSSFNSNVLASSLLSSYHLGGWGLFDSFGLWVYSPQYGYCFMPFGWGWSNPYGFDYRSGINWWQLHRVLNDPRYQPIPTNYGTGAIAGGRRIPPAPTGAQATATKPQQPAFTEIEKHQRGRITSWGGDNGYPAYGRRDSTPGTGSYGSGSPMGGSGPSRSGSSAGPGPAFTPSGSSAGPRGRISPIN